ncbi:VOC family protein [Aquipuribacter hungaricus]|uniref:VOC family protein n=1 Tax=Aquipuribacter hungaricus TaxID=545624 RepID=A0ABV7WCC7_9MICO
MLDHVGIPAADVEASAAFYLALMAPAGWREATRIPTPGGPVLGLAAGDGPPDFWLSPTAGPLAGELHLAFVVADRAVVDAVHGAAVTLGAEVLHAPREWPEYHPGYYAVFVRDPDGHNVEAVVHS